ncbi:hypothetical protein AB6D11_02635 [Vibrio splendidus]
MKYTQNRLEELSQNVSKASDIIDIFLPSVVSESWDNEAIIAYTLNASKLLIDNIQLFKGKRPVKLQNEEQYIQYLRVRNHLDVLYIKGEFDHDPIVRDAVKHASEVTGNEIIKYNNGLLAKDKHTIAKIRYLLWGSYFTNVDKVEVIADLIKEGFIYSNPYDDNKKSLWVHGIKLSVFNRSYTRNDNPCYVKVIGRQVFPIHLNEEQLATMELRHKELFNSLKPFNINKNYETYVGGTLRKGTAKAICPTREQKEFILSTYSNTATIAVHM